MTKTQIRQFVRKIHGSDIKIKYFQLKDRPHAWAYVHDKAIHLSEDILRENEIFIKMALLHELGHLNSTYCKTKSKREYDAQIWAINKTDQLGMTRLKKELIKMLKEWDCTGTWWKERNGWRYYRRYILASRLAKKNGII